MITFGNSVLSFSWRGLPKDVHLSISYQPKDGYINLHVTRNIGSPGDKPKVEIVRVAKVDAEAILGCMCQACSKGYLHL